MGHAADGRDRGRAHQIATVGGRDGFPGEALRGDHAVERGRRVGARRAQAGGGALSPQPLEPFPLNPWSPFLSTLGALSLEPLEPFPLNP